MAEINREVIQLDEEIYPFASSGLITGAYRLGARGGYSLPYELSNIDGKSVPIDIELQPGKASKISCITPYHPAKGYQISPEDYLLETRAAKVSQVKDGFSEVDGPLSHYSFKVQVNEYQARKYGWLPTIFDTPPSGMLGRLRLDIQANGATYTSLPEYQGNQMNFVKYYPAEGGPLASNFPYGQFAFGLWLRLPEDTNILKDIPVRFFLETEASKKGVRRIWRGVDYPTENASAETTSNNPNHIESLIQALSTASKGLVERNTTLMQENSQLRRELDAVKQENTELGKSAKKEGLTFISKAEILKILSALEAVETRAKQAEDRVVILNRQAAQAIIERRELASEIDRARQALQAEKAKTTQLQRELSQAKANTPSTAGARRGGYDPYQVLGLDRTVFAGLDDTAVNSFLDGLKRNWSQIHHPDRGGKTKRMQDINSAIDCLKDPSKRHYYST